MLIDPSELGDSPSRRLTFRREEERVIFVGDDWAEAHHDVCVLDEQGKVLAKRRIPEGLAGITQFHALVSSPAITWLDFPS